MAKPVAAYIQLPSDAGNAGKQVRTQTQVISAQTVHTHFFVPISQRTVEGIYYADPGLQTVQASAQNATSTGFIWLWNASGNTTNMALKRIKVEHTISATTVFQSNPRIQVALFTAMGTASGATVSPAKRATADASAQGSVRTAMTGLTVTLGNGAHSTLPVSNGTTTPSPSVAHPVELLGAGSAEGTTDEDAKIVLATGEGAAIYQPDAGTASDTRKFDLDIVWVEHDNS